MIKKEAKKMLKYKDLTIQTQRMWNVKTKVIPVIIGATGTISKVLTRIPEISGSMEISQRYLQSFHVILRCVISVVCRKINGEVNISHD